MGPDLLRPESGTKATGRQSLSPVFGIGYDGDGDGDEPLFDPFQLYPPTEMVRLSSAHLFTRILI